MNRPRPAKRRFHKPKGELLRALKMIHELCCFLEWREDFVVEDAQENVNVYQKAIKFLKRYEYRKNSLYDVLLSRKIAVQKGRA